MSDFLPPWLLLTGLYLTMAHFGGIEWLHKRDIGPFADTPVAVWKKVWLLLWCLGTAAAIVGGLTTHL